MRVRERNGMTCLIPLSTVNNSRPINVLQNLLYFTIFLKQNLLKIQNYWFFLSVKTPQRIKYFARSLETAKSQNMMNFVRSVPLD